MRIATLVLLPLLTAACATAPAGRERPSSPFAYVEASANAIETTGPIRLRVEAPPEFRATSATHRNATFGDHPYEVSLAALLGNEEAVMVHGERVADRSGASNYDALPAAGWPDARFRLRSMCAPIDAATIEQEHDLAFLRRHGWNPEGVLALEQYLATSPDHNEEVVISLVARVSDCARGEEVQSTLRRLRDRVRVSELD